MKDNKKLYTLLGILVIILISGVITLFILLNGEDKNQQVNNDEKSNTEKDEEKTEKKAPDLSSNNEIAPEEEKDKNEKQNENNKLSLSEPEKLEGFYEKEFNMQINGSYDGNLLMMFSKGYDELVTYNIDKDDRKVIEEFTDFQAIDPETGRIVYTKLNDEDSNGPQTLATIGHKNHKKRDLTELEKGEKISDGAIFKGVFFYVSQFDGESDSQVKAYPIDFVNDEEFYENVSNALEGNSFSNVSTDGERLLMSSNDEQKISEFTDGSEDKLVDLSDDDLDYVKLVDVQDDTFIYTTTPEGMPENVKNVHSNVTDNIQLDDSEVLNIHLLDQDHMIISEFLGPDERNKNYLYNLKTNEKEHLGDKMTNITVSGNTLFYSQEGDFKSVDISYK